MAKSKRKKAKEIVGTYYGINPHTFKVDTVFHRGRMLYLGREPGSPYQIHRGNTVES
jgi:hypothetical protein